MKKNLISAALEEAIINPDEAPVLTETEIDLDNSQQEADRGEIAADSDRVEETEGIATVLDANISDIEQKVADDKPLDESQAEMLAVSVEHFAKRLGYTPKVVPAIEGFKDIGTSMANTKLALENLKSLRAQIDPNLAVAKEGLLSRIVNATERAFTSSEKIERNIDEAVEKLSRNGSIDGKLKDAAWARIFITQGYSVDAAKVHVLIDSVKRFNKDILPLISKIGELLREGAHAVDQSMFIAKDSEVAKIKSLREEALVVAKSFKIEDRLHRKGSVDASPLSIEEAKKLAKEVHSFMNDHDTVRARKEIYEIVSSANYKAFTNINLRLIGPYAADMRAYIGLIEDAINPCLEIFNNSAEAEYLICYGVYKWIKASTK